MSAAHWWTNVSCSLANWCQLLIGQLMSAAHWPTDVSFSLANWYKLLIGQLMSASHWTNDVSCSLAKLCQLLIGQRIYAAHWPTNFSFYIVLVWKSRIGGSIDRSEQIFYLVDYPLVLKSGRLTDTHHAALEVELDVSWSSKFKVKVWVKGKVRWR